MASNWRSKFVKCPYYKKHDSGRIVCEGMIPGTSTHIVFQTMGELRRHMESHCNGIRECLACPMHDLLDRENS